MTNQRKLETIRHPGESRHPEIIPAGVGNRSFQAEGGIMTGMAEQSRRFMARCLRWNCLLILVLMILPGFSPFAFCKSMADTEEKAVLQAARKFLDAEIRRDYPMVWTCFAPSSVYLRTHSYKQYLAEAKVAPDRVVAYKIIRISYIQNNKDPQTISTAEKIAQVEVDVTFLHEGSQKRSVVNIGFIFLKEGGKWYKS